MFFYHPYQDYHGDVYRDFNKASRIEQCISRYSSADMQSVGLETDLRDYRGRWLSYRNRERRGMFASRGQLRKGR